MIWYISRYSSQGTIELSELKYAPLATSFKDLHFESSKQEAWPYLPVQIYILATAFTLPSKAKEHEEETRDDSDSDFFVCFVYLILKHIASSIGSISPSHKRRIKAKSDVVFKCYTNTTRIP